MIRLKDRVILASKSAARRQMLEQVGLVFDSIPAQIDERAIEARFENSAPAATANLSAPEALSQELARQKALFVAKDNPQALVIGSDSVVALGDEILHKAQNMDEAFAKLQRLSGQTHRLISSVAVARGQVVLWSKIETASLTMRQFDAAFLQRYLRRVGPKAALSCVGAYKLEAEGAWLFSEIKGDYHTILGMPLIPLLNYLQDYHADE
ncbi:MAG: Maf family protein [Alphaproteobacteria bacterium]